MTEMFGNFTSQPDIPNPNGYNALAVFDGSKDGGNGNGRIDPGDMVYARLRLWIDRNHNGISESNELIRLSALGVVSIGLRYRETHLTDRFGNEFRYVSRIVDEHGRENPRSYDVFLLTQPILIQQ